MPLTGDTQLLVYIGGAGLLVVIFLILLISMIRRSAKKREEAAAAEMEARIEPSEPEMAPRIEQSKPEPAPRIDLRMPEQVPVVTSRHPNGAHLWRDPRTGKVMAEVDGIEFSNPHDLTPEQRRKLVLVLKEVAAWIQDPVAKPAPVSAAQSKPVSTMPAIQPRPTPPPPPPRPTPVSEQPDTATMYVEPRKTGSLTSPGDKAADAKKTAPFSIVTQIDAILQGMLVDSPLKGKGIRLVEDLKGGVTVWVGLQRYPGIDAVTDPEALAIIRAAVAEWERYSSS
jgi:hypothetical protein